MIDQDGDQFFDGFTRLLQVEGDHAAWDTRFFSALHVTSQQRALKIVDLVFDSKAVRQEIESADRELRSKKLTHTVWRWFTAVRDNVSVFSDGYRELMDWTVAALGPARRVVDYGAGTGNILARLKLAGPERQVIGLDISAENIALAERKLKHFAGPRSNDLLFVADLTRPSDRDAVTRGADGAVTINVTYTLPPSKRRPFIQRMFDDLVPGGQLVFNDPLPVSADRERIRGFAQSVAADAVKNGGPMTEFDLAWMAYFNATKVAETSQSNLYSGDRLRELLHSVGFKTLPARESYYGMNIFLLLRKPD